MRLILGLALLLAACDRSPAVPTTTENRDLDDADNLLDAAENNLAAIDTGELDGNQP
jgi:hypothetical protein